jgi:hypothetical protein
MYEIRNEDGQVVSRHATAAQAQTAAQAYRLDCAMGWTMYDVFGPVADTFGDGLEDETITGWAHGRNVR